MSIFKRDRLVKWAPTGIAVLAVLALAAGRMGAQGGGGAAPPQGGGGRGGQAAPPENVLAGVIDTHHHHDPDERARNMDIIDAALYDRLKGMRGAVFKSHGQETSGVAWLAAKMVPNFVIIPVMDLNLAHGGMNKWAVEQFATIVKKPNNPSHDVGVIMMASDMTCYQRQVSKSTEPCVAVAKDGKLLPEVIEIIAIIKKHGMVMNGGHNSPDENVLLAREAQRMGVPFSVGHVNLDPPGLQLSHMQEIGKLGGYLEFASQSQRVGNATVEARNTTMADMMRKLGPQYVILSTDLGQANNEPVPDGLERFILNLRAKGFTKAETDMMSKTNVAKLLGLPAPAP